MNFAQFLVFLAVAFSLIGQTLDSYTTEKALDAGFSEANPVAKWLISKIGIDGLWAIKAAGFGLGLPVIFFVAFHQSNLAAILAGAVVGTEGLVAAILNAKQLVAAKKATSILSALNFF